MSNDRPLSETNFVVLDIETTGLDPAEHRILRIQAVRISGLAIDPQEQSWLVSPGPDLEIPSATWEAVDLDPEQVRVAKSFAEVLPEIQRVVGEHPVAGHNLLEFGLPFLLSEIRRAGTGRWQPTPTIDTKLIARNLRPRLRPLTLRRCVDAFVPGADAGRDASPSSAAGLAAALFAAQLRELAQRGVRTLGELHAFVGVGTPALLGSP